MSRYTVTLYTVFQRKPPRALSPGPGRSFLNTLVPACPLARWAFFVPLSAEPLSSKTQSGLKVGAVPRVRRRRSRTSRHMHGLWPTCFVHPCHRTSSLNFCEGPLSVPGSVMFCAAENLCGCSQRLADLGRKRWKFRADETQRNVTMNLDFFIDLTLAYSRPSLVRKHRDRKHPKGAKPSTTQY